MNEVIALGKISQKTCEFILVAITPQEREIRHVQFARPFADPLDCMDVAAHKVARTAAAPHRYDLLSIFALPTHPTHPHPFMHP